MRGLLYREFILNKKTQLLNLCFVVLLEILGILIRLSLVCGNLAKLGRADFYQTEQSTYYIFLILPVFLMAASMNLAMRNTVSDYSCKWVLFQYTTPVDESTWLLTKLLKNMILGMAALCIFAVNSLLFRLIAGRQFFDTHKEIFSKKAFTACVMIVCFIFAMYSFSLYLSIKYKNVNAVTFRFAAVFGILSIALNMYLFHALEQFRLKSLALAERNDAGAMSFYIYMTDKFKGHTILLGSIFAAIICLITISGYLLAVRELKRRNV